MSDGLIACLGWGSLIWEPKKLPITGEWKKDGPELPLEFARQSNDDRMTLVIDRSFSKVTSLWIKLNTTDLEHAKKALKLREKTADHFIGTWKRGQDSPEAIPNLCEWAEKRGLSGIVWTALPPKYQGVKGQTPTIDQVIQLFESLQDNKLQKAKEYVQRAPAQIRTPYREAIEKQLGWLPIK